MVKWPTYVTLLLIGSFKSTRRIMNTQNIQFQWYGAEDAEGGTAVYTTESRTYEIWLPSFEAAWNIEKVLRDVFREGETKGRQEVVSLVREALEYATRKDLT